MAALRDWLGCADYADACRHMHMLQTWAISMSAPMSVGSEHSVPVGPGLWLHGLCYCIGGIMISGHS
jgi:hypothetical protein